jgi:hypothetical protein
MFTRILNEDGLPDLGGHFWLVDVWFSGRVVEALRA